VTDDLSLRHHLDDQLLLALAIELGVEHPLPKQE
jgi:hypothetical protein